MSQRVKLAVTLCCLALCGTAAITHRYLEMRRASVRPAELREIVWEQIGAFREADYSKAYRHASTRFQERFNVDAFGELVRSDYPDLVRATRVEFGTVRISGRNALVQVFFFLPDGDVIPCLYSLINEEEGWKIDAARLQKRWPPGRRLRGLRT